VGPGQHLDAIAAVSTEPCTATACLLACGWWGVPWRCRMQPQPAREGRQAHGSAVGSANAAAWPQRTDCTIAALLPCRTPAATPRLLQAAVAWASPWTAVSGLLVLVPGWPWLAAGCNLALRGGPCGCWDPSACPAAGMPDRSCSHSAADEADWNIVKKGWDAHVLGEAPHYFKDAATAVKTLRVRGCHKPARVAATARVAHQAHPSASCWKNAADASALVVTRSVLMSRLPSCPLARSACFPQKDGSEKPVSDQWLDPFVIVDDDDKPVGTIEDGEGPAAHGRGRRQLVLARRRGRGHLCRPTLQWLTRSGHAVLSLPCRRCRRHLQLPRRPRD
jgi:hypothetical protein